MADGITGGTTSGTVGGDTYELDDGSQAGSTEQTKETLFQQILGDALETYDGEVIKGDPDSGPASSTVSLPAPTEKEAVDMAIMLEMIRTKLADVTEQSSENDIKSNNDRMLSQDHKVIKDMEKAASHTAKQKKGGFWGKVASWASIVLASVTIAVGAALAITGVGTGLGVLMMVGGAIALGTAIAQKTGELGKLADSLAKNVITPMLEAYGMDPDKAKMIGKIVAQAVISIAIIGVMLAVSCIDPAAIEGAIGEIADFATEMGSTIGAMVSAASEAGEAGEEASEVVEEVETVATEIEEVEEGIEDGEELGDGIEKGSDLADKAKKTAEETKKATKATEWVTKLQKGQWAANTTVSLGGTAAGGYSGYEGYEAKMSNADADDDTATSELIKAMIQNEIKMLQELAEKGNEIDKIVASMLKDKGTVGLDLAKMLQRVQT